MKIPCDIMQRKDLSSSAKLVYVAIVDRMGTNNQSWPGVRRISLDAGVTTRTVVMAVRQLEKFGLLVVEKAHGRTNRYQLSTVEEINTPAVLESSTASGEETNTAGVSKISPVKIFHQRKEYNTGVLETNTKVCEKLTHNQTNEPDPSNQTNTSSPSVVSPSGGEVVDAAEELFGLVGPDTTDLLHDWLGHGRVSTHMLMSIGQLVKDHSAHTVNEGVRICIENNRKTFAYLRAVVENGSQRESKTNDFDEIPF